MVPARFQVRRQFLALEDEAAVRLVPGNIDGLIDQGLVGNDAARLDAAGRCDDCLRGRIIDSRCQFVCGEPAEDDGMNDTKTRASQHRHHGLGDHRHVDDGPVAFDEALVGQHAGHGLHLFQKLRIGVACRPSGNRAVVDKCRLAGTTALHVPVQAVVAGVALPIRIPAAILPLIGIEHLVARRDPVDFLSGLFPEPERILFPALVDLVIPACHDNVLPNTSPETQLRLLRPRVL